MNKVRVYFRRVTFNFASAFDRLDHPFRTVIHSFDPIPDTAFAIPHAELGERSSFEVEIPQGFEMKIVAKPDLKGITTPDSEHLDVLDVVARMHNGSDGFRLVTSPPQNN